MNRLRGLAVTGALSLVGVVIAAALLRWSAAAAVMVPTLTRSLGLRAQTSDGPPLQAYA